MSQTIFMRRRIASSGHVHTDKIDLFCHQIDQNDDHTYLVHWGYENHGSRTLTYASKDCHLIVHKGGAIAFPGGVPNVFLPGRHYDCFSTVVTQDTILTWKVKKICVEFRLDQYLNEKNPLYQS